MTITALTAPPTPPNANADRAMFVWINGAAGNAADPIKNDTNIQALITWCGNNNINLVYLDVYSYIGGTNWNPAQLARAVRYLHASGIRVYALAGNNDWAHNEQWVAKNVLQKIAAYQVIQDGLVISGLSGTGDAAFDGVILDVEYWTLSGGYTGTEPIGLCDLMNAARRFLSLPVGCFATQWLADPTSAALTVTYGGVSQLEGLHLMDHADFVAVACYFNNSTAQINTFTNWYNYASVTGLNRNFGLFCGSETESGVTGTYWTGAPGAKAAMETAHTAISASFTGAPNTNVTFRGQCIDPYSPGGGASGYAQMT